MVTLIENPLRIGLQQDRIPEPQILIIFGASGDLTQRKLIPAIYQMKRERRLPPELTIVGVARRPWSHDYFREHMREGIEQFGEAVGAGELIGGQVGVARVTVAARQDAKPLPFALIAARDIFNEVRAGEWRCLGDERGGERVKRGDGAGDGDVHLAGVVPDPAVEAKPHRQPLHERAKADGVGVGWMLVAVIQAALGNQSEATEALVQMASLSPALARDPAAYFRFSRVDEPIAGRLVEGLRRAGWKEPDAPAAAAEKQG